MYSLREGIIFTACILTAFSISYCTNQWIGFKDLLDTANPLRPQLKYEKKIDTRPLERLQERFRRLEDNVGN